MKNEKVLFFSLVVICFMFVCCKSTNVYNLGDGIADIRDGISEVEREQAESLGLAEKVGEQIGESRTELQNAISELERGTEKDGDFESICNAIRKRGEQPEN